MPKNSVLDYKYISNDLKKYGLQVDSNGMISAGPVDLQVGAQILYDMELSNIVNSNALGQNYLTSALFVYSSGVIQPGQTGIITSDFANGFRHSLNPKGGGVDLPLLMDNGMSTGKLTPRGMWRGSYIWGRSSFPAGLFIEYTEQPALQAIQAAYGPNVSVTLLGGGGGNTPSWSIGGTAHTVYSMYGTNTNDVL